MKWAPTKQRNVPSGNCHPSRRIEHGWAAKSGSCGAGDLLFSQARARTAQTDVISKFF